MRPANPGLAIAYLSSLRILSSDYLDFENRDRKLLGIIGNVIKRHAAKSRMISISTLLLLLQTP